MKLKEALEALIRYLALVALSDYLQEGAFEIKVNTHIQDKIGRPLTSGAWLELLREVVRAFITHKKTPSLAGFVPLLSTRTDKLQPTQFLRQIEALIAWRNDVVHPVEQRDPDVQKTYGEFEKLLTDLHFLSNYDLVVPLDTVKGAPNTICAVMVCMGTTFELKKNCCVEIPASLAKEVELELSPVLLDPTGQKVLMALYPLCLHESDPEELYNYLSSTWKNNHPSSLTFWSQPTSNSRLANSAGRTADL